MSNAGIATPVANSRVVMVGPDSSGAGAFVEVHAPSSASNTSNQERLEFGMAF